MASVTLLLRVKQPSPARRTETVPFTGCRLTDRPSWTDPQLGGGEIGEGNVLQRFLTIGIVKSLQRCFNRAHLVLLCQGSPLDKFQGRR